MRIVRGDIWDYHRRGAFVVVPTNTCTRADGTAVMGAGLAKQAAERFPQLPEAYGFVLCEIDPLTGEEATPEEWHNPELPWIYEPERLVLFPTKCEWRKGSMLKLIHQNLESFTQQWGSFNAEQMRAARKGPFVAWPMLGCGLGGLNWETEVRPLMERYLQCERFAVVLPGTAGVGEVPREAADGPRAGVGRDGGAA